MNDATKLTKGCTDKHSKSGNQTIQRSQLFPPSRPAAVDDKPTHRRTHSRSSNRIAQHTHRHQRLCDCARRCTEAAIIVSSCLRITAASVLRRSVVSVRPQNGSFTGNNAGQQHLSTQLQLPLNTRGQSRFPFLSGAEPARAGSNPSHPLESSLRPSQSLLYSIVARFGVDPLLLCGCCDRSCDECWNPSRLCDSFGDVGHESQHSHHVAASASAASAVRRHGAIPQVREDRGRNIRRRIQSQYTSHSHTPCNATQLRLHCASFHLLLSPSPLLSPLLPWLVSHSTWRCAHCFSSLFLCRLLTGEG
jgi:hypothetical protein